MIKKKEGRRKNPKRCGASADAPYLMVEQTLDVQNPTFGDEQPGMKNSSTPKKMAPTAFRTDIINLQEKIELNTQLNEKQP